MRPATTTPLPSEATPLTLKPVKSSSLAAQPRPIPTSSRLRPWVFTYTPSPDGKDTNLLIMFHGLGDTNQSFSQLGKKLALPATAVLSLQAPIPVPLMDMPSWMWYNTFDPMYNPLPNPDPTPTIPALRRLLIELTSPDLGWELHQIHLFGWGQGGTMALELALNVARDPLSVTTPTSSTASPSATRKLKRVGSAVSICAGLASFPSTTVAAGTPVLYFTRLDSRSAVGVKAENSLKRAFAHVDVERTPNGTRIRGSGEAMPEGKEEWTGVMRFWGQVLGRADEGWKGDGEVYEVVR